MYVAIGYGMRVLSSVSAGIKIYHRGPRKVRKKASFDFDNVTLERRNKYSDVHAWRYKLTEASERPAKKDE